MNKTKLYFRSKQQPKYMFSSEVFNEPNGSINIMEPPNIVDKSNTMTFKQFNNIIEVLNDKDAFTICTDDSFTKDELIMIQDVLYAHGFRTYSEDKILSVIRKIESMIMSGSYLPKDKTEIIRK